MESQPRAKGREMKSFDDAALRRLKIFGRKRASILLPLLLLPCLISACRNTFGPTSIIGPPLVISVESLKEKVSGGTPNSETKTLEPPETPIVPIEASAAANECAAESGPHDHLFYLPEHPVAHEPLRIVATTRQVSAEPMSLTVRNADGQDMKPARLETWGYTPRAISTYFRNLPPGKYDVRFLPEQGSGTAVCGTLSVGKSDSADEVKAPASGVWEARRDWSPAFEDLYSVFIAKLFYVRPGGRKGWHPLHQATRDPYRNIFYGILGLDEDEADGETHVVLEPDCADAPFQLRAYFAWKMGLPFVFNRCLRGSSVTGPQCIAVHNNQSDRFDDISDPVERFNAFAAVQIGWKVHAGNGRTLPSSTDGDLYPVPLSVESIRPGTVFVDAGGHLLVVSQVEPQTESHIGMLYGVDAHPDRTVTHKQFSLGTFVFNHRVPTDGFKMFRPAVRQAERLRFLSNDELAEQGFFPVSKEQAALSDREVFYDGISKMLNPTPLDPASVLRNKLDVLHTAMRERVEAVAVGVAYMKENNWREMTMPAGSEIFETTGPWEIYSTPARDMRCFLAIDDVMKFPNQAVKNRAQYRVDAAASDDELLRTLESVRDEGLLERTISYERSDGTPWELSLRDVVDRQEILETAYNPNDCIETRWGAKDGTEEKQTCNRRAPPDQRFKMKLARRWFVNRQRPDQR